MNIQNISTSSYSTTSIGHWLLRRWKFSCALVLLVLLVRLIIPPPAAAYTTNMNASVVIGQPDFTSSGTNFNGGSLSGRGFNLPTSVASDGEKLIVADFNNSRVLIFNKIPTSNAASADVVLGKANMTTTTAGTPNFSGPLQVFVANGKLLISDSNNDRIFIYNKIPTESNVMPDVVIGQTDFTTTTGGTSATKLDQPDAIFYDQNTGKLLISEGLNDRVLIYNSIPTANGATANVVLGQVDFITNGTGTAADKMNNPNAITVVNGKLYVTDFSNNRVLVWNSIPTTNGAAADFAIGQPDLTSTKADQNLADSTSYTLEGPRGIYSDGRRLYVTDASNWRLLIYSSFPTTNNHSADIVIGQPDFSSDSQNQGGNPGANNFGAPQRSFIVVGKKLIVPDGSNRRVLIFEDKTDSPKPLFTSSPYQLDKETIRFEGEVSLSGGEHSIWKIESSVDGGPFGNVTSLTDTTRTNPGLPDDKIAKFYHDIKPTKLSEYLVSFKALSTNTDTTTFSHFTPFKLNSVSSLIPSGYTLVASGSSGASRSHAVSFSVYPRVDLLTNDLDHYEVWTKPITNSSITNNQWSKYIDEIPVSYTQARELTDNLLTNLDNNTPEGDNGTYENGNLKVTYTNSSATLQVSSKTPLAYGTYQVKVLAVNKSGHTQETLPQELVIKNPKPYTVNPNKPRVQGVSNQAPTGAWPKQGVNLEKPSPAPKPSPSPQKMTNDREGGFLQPIVDFFEALVK